MSRQLEVVAGYLRHRFRAQSKYHLHSPFIYEFYKEVLKDAHLYTQYRVINRLRKELGTASRFIKRKDLGARCRDFPSDQRFVRVKDLVHHASVSRKKGEFLFRLIHYFKPATILELGTSLGMSAIYFGLAAPGSRIITIEGCIDSANLARENFEKAGLENIEVITGTFEEKLEVALAGMPSPDLVFFDGNHKKEPTLNYFKTCMRHVHPGSIFIFDDIHWSSGMEEAWREICRNPGVRVTIDLYFLGIAFFRDELSKEDYSLKF
jgi:predicted O-methyltransferase YrrM